MKFYNNKTHDTLIQTDKNREFICSYGKHKARKEIQKIWENRLKAKNNEYITVY